MDSAKNFTFCQPFATIVWDDSGIGYMQSNFDISNVIIPVTLVSVLSAIFWLILRPLGKFTFVSHMLAGILMGPSFLERVNKNFSKKLFTPKAMTVLNLFESVGIIYMIFVLSVRVDIKIIKKTGRLALVIGIGSFLLPLLVTIYVSSFLKDAFQLEENLVNSLRTIAALESTISIHVVLSLLTDLKLLNSELGRLAVSSSLISTVVNWFVVPFTGNPSSQQTQEPPPPHGRFKNAGLLMFLSVAFIIVFIVFGIRPTMVSMMRRTPDGRSLKHGHVGIVHLMILVCSLLGEITGLHGYFGAMILGISTPSTPPMGSPLIDRIEAVVSTVFMPCFLVNAGRRVSLFSVGFNTFLAVELMIVVATLVKFFAVIIPSLYFRLPLNDALSLGLILNCRGIYDVQIFSRASQQQMITGETFAVMVTSSMLKSAIAITLVRVVYDPSRRYVAYRRHTIQHSTTNTELRVLACINDQDNVATILNIIQISNSPRSPLAVFVMNFEEYVGDYVPVVIQHRLEERSETSSSSSKPSEIDPLINALRLCKQSQKGLKTVQCFTAIAPFASMHDDVCLMAFEKGTSLVIIPFQRSNSPSTRIVTKNIIKMAPCSVGILYDRGIFMDPKPIFSRQLTICVCALFIGGPDDREALAFGARMAENHSITITIIRFIAMDNAVDDLVEESCDSNMINGFRMTSMNNNNVEYVTRSVKEGAETLRVLNAIGDDFDLILVGRRHYCNSQVLLGLSDWNEIEELGVVGDILASAHFVSRASVMVIQQQASVVEGIVGTYTNSQTR